MSVGAQLLLHDVDLPRLQPHHLRVLLRHDLDDDAIEIGQGLPAIVLAPVARVAIVDQPLPGLVAREHERPEAHDLGRRRARRPRLVERARAQRRLQLVARHDRQVVEHAHARGERRGKGDDHRARIGRASPRTACRLTRSEPPTEPTVWYAASNEKSTSADVNGTPSDQVTPSRSVIVCVNPSSEAAHFSASHGSSSIVVRLMRTSFPWVR